MTNFFKAALCASMLFLAGASAKVNRTNAVLTVLEEYKDLTAFYELFKSTGGGIGIPEPAFEERFNDNNVGLDFTILAPTNEAIAKVYGLTEKLTTAVGYPLLTTLLRTHILPGKLAPHDLYNKNIVSIEGFSIHTDSKGVITTNPGLTKTDVRARTQAKLLKDKRGKPIRVPASNGHSPSKSMKDILAADPETSRARELLYTVAPWFPRDRLDMSFSGRRTKENSKVVYLVPSNEALKSFTKVAEAPGNADATRFFLMAGFGRMDGKHIKGRAGFKLEIEGGRVMNAEVEKRECGSNGCVWRIGRVIDSVYGLF
ncbi:hypothetical protein FOC1_g10010161 [Fusarium oxysporum f. sp. cubense race 1]|uniref:FAS1 domain-containing protein n=1 Tax=Fusarium oxysporum f. sp. cubense (strain race 1) TaxID=1229664 RepID=N4TZF4_FUSC1|nr:hypothetical protein FOC1_g10010161 [Fusarium oxysporum f. sp. cubense race 1]